MLPLQRSAWSVLLSSMISDSVKIGTELQSYLGAFGVLSHLVLVRFTEAVLLAGKRLKADSTPCPLVKIHCFFWFPPLPLPTIPLPLMEEGPHNPRETLVKRIKTFVVRKLTLTFYPHYTSCHESHFSLLASGSRHWSPPPCVGTPGPFGS